jgi:PAS domain S-box-containing protein
MAVVSTIIALVLTLLVPHARRDPFFTLFTVAVAITTWIGGARPGLTALLFSVVCVTSLFELRASFWGSIHDVAQFLFFLATALFIIWLIDALQSSRQQLRNSEIRMRTLTEAVPQLLWSTDANGNVDYLSQQWLDYTGQTLEQATGSGWQDVLHPEERERVIAAWRYAVESATVYEVECRLRRADGAYRWMLSRGLPLRDRDGKVQEWFGTCTDIHDQITAEEGLRRAEKLAATGRLASTMAHEINNPLASVTNLLFLARTSPGLTDDVCRDYLARADKELARVTHMVGQVLGFFGESTSPTLVSIPETVNDLLTIYAGKITAKKLRIEQKLEDNLELRAVRGELRRVLANLLVNAIDVSPIGGIICLRAHGRRAWNAPECRGVSITVADQGAGIQVEDRSKLFEPFFTTKQDVGTGLALWASKRMIERWNGRIRFRSSTQPGRSGTVFSVFLPAPQARAQASSSLETNTSNAAVR